MNRHVRDISRLLSLRTPQKRALEILDAFLAESRLERHTPLAESLRAAQAIANDAADVGNVADFERAFANLCFGLATGVGKTRLMGAFIAYLHAEHGIRNFFVVAPNLTIYNKLKADFTPNTKKYVFRGIQDFAVKAPTVITGDNFEDKPQAVDLFERDDVIINIFNISKINATSRPGEKKKGKKSKVPRVRRLTEYLGQSYFEFLAGKDDLVVLMDEAHRYRASASMQAIDDLKPLLGLELTATPQTEKGKKSIPFRNVVYRYGLAEAMRDGFVKEPAVATRKGVKISGMKAGQLDRLKLEDGVHLHETVTTELATYAVNNGVARVKPFMLVIARDTTHSAELVNLIESEQFFEGRYAGKVIEVHSGKSGSEKDDVVERLLKVESPEEPTEIVVHVNMLKEGWDVTNLYTIVPLRAADSKTLVEQSIGRGLRLPYGRRVGKKGEYTDTERAVNRLTIVAHDKFQEIVDEAKKQGFAFQQIEMNDDGVVTTQESVVVSSTLDHVTGVAEPKTEPETTEGGDSPTQTPAVKPPPKPQFHTDEQKATAKAAVKVIKAQANDILKKQGKSLTPQSLKDPEVQKALVEAVKDEVSRGQQKFEFDTLDSVVSDVVPAVTELYIAHTIAVPRIVVLPKAGSAQAGFTKFNLELSALTFTAISDEVLVQELQSGDTASISVLGGDQQEQRLSDYVVRALISFDDVSYDDQADVLYHLADQVVAHLRSYLVEDEKVRNVLRFQEKRIGDLVHAQMLKHTWEEDVEYEARASTGFQDLKPQAYNMPKHAKVQPFEVPPDRKKDIRKMLFGGFSTRALYPACKFDSDSERRFACILEKDPTVLRWAKPGKGVFQIRYSQDRDYEPDFVVETNTEKLLCEPKQSNQMQDEVVQAKAKAAAVWCARATAFELENGGKPWRYVLIEHDAITDNQSLAGLVQAYEVKAPAGAG